MSVVSNSTVASTSSFIPDLSSLNYLSISYFAQYAFIALGALLYPLQQNFQIITDRINSFFFITAAFRENDAAYIWVMHWLSKQPVLQNARNVEVTTGGFIGSGGLASFRTNDDPGPSTKDKWHRLAYVPCLSRPITFWYRGRWIYAVRVNGEKTGFWGETGLLLSILTFDNSVLASLLQEAKDAYIAYQDLQMSVYASDPMDRWRQVAACSKRPLQSIILDPGVKEDLLKDAREFLRSREWYRRRGIPYRRGYLLYGPPGTGKTSVIQSLAGELGLDVYIVTLSRRGMDDAGLAQLISDLPPKCVAIMEDIDAALVHNINRKKSTGEKDGSDQAEDESPVPRQSQRGEYERPSGVTLSGLLNAIDGVGAQEGRLLFATTNKYDALDTALRRPGRMDKHVRFKLTSRYQAKELFCRFYEPAELPDTEKKGETPVVLVEQDVNGPGEKYRAVDPDDAIPHVAADLEVLASRFAEAIPDRKLSMASLQGYLMGYKTSPQDAVEQAASWAEREGRPDEDGGNMREGQEG